MKLPKGQILWATYYKAKTRYDGKAIEKWAITSDEARVKWYLYNLEGEMPRKVKTGKSPKEFEEEIGHI